MQIPQGGTSAASIVLQILATVFSGGSLAVAARLVFQAGRICKTIDDNQKTLDDHEKRIRVLEKVDVAWLTKQA